jgi:hypothetical protein
MRKTWKAAAATLLDSRSGEWFLHDEAGLKLLGSRSILIRITFMRETGFVSAGEFIGWPVFREASALT